MMPEQPGKLSFPCVFTFKIIGLATDQFETEVMTLMRHHFPKIGEAAIKSRPSNNGKYLALSITVAALSQEQLDNAYRALTDSPQVLFAL